MANYVKASGLLQLEGQYWDELLLHVDNFPFGEFLTANFVVDGVDFERVDFLVLGGHEHGCHSHKVQVGNF